MPKETLRGEVNVRRALPPSGRHYFFAYYDLQGFDETGKHHLCHQAAFRDRMPTKGDTALLGAVSLETNRFEVFAETGAFNFQQGAMLQYMPQGGHSVFYNTRAKDGDFCGYGAVVHNLKTGGKKHISAPAACLSPTGKQALGVNFARLFDFRPGYGYGGAADPFAHLAAPENDGLFSIDLETGASKLLASYADLSKAFGLPLDVKVVINHVTFAPGGKKLMFLLRSFPRGGPNWGTFLAVMDANGENLSLLAGPALVSHYHWRDETNLLLWAEFEQGRGLYLLNTETNEKTPFAHHVLREDIHCIYSPDRKLVLGDGYPDKDGFRKIYLLNGETGDGGVILSAFSPPPSSNDARCDLHVRWNRSGTAFSFDSTHQGETGLYWADLPESAW